MPQRHLRTCNLCEAMCGLVLDVDDDRVVSVRGDADDPFSRGYLCPKGAAIAALREDPDRVRRPLKREGSGFREIPWDQALGEVADGLRRIQRLHGRDAVGLYAGNPTVHNHGASIYLQPFGRTLGTRNKFDANSQDANPRLYACAALYGSATAVPVPDLDRTSYLLMLGANPAASGGSLMTLGDVRGRLQGIRKRGGKIVVIDPRRTETAAWADEHHFIRPGGDAALLLALLHEVLRLGVDEQALAQVAQGLTELRALARGYAAERVAAAVGLPAATIQRLAREFRAARPAVAYGRVGVCQNPFGPAASWLLDALNVVTGNFDCPGGVMFPLPAADPTPLLGRGVGPRRNRFQSRVRGLPEFSGTLPAAVMAEEMEVPGPGQLRAFISLAGNPVLSTPEGERLSRALAKLDLLVAIDPALNETSRLAHYILPPVHALERSHYDLVFHTLAVRNTAKFGAAVLQKPAGGLEDWEILYELGMRLGGLRLGGPRWLDRTLRLAWRAGMRLSPDRLVDLLLRRGAYPGLSLRALQQHAHGLDLGALMPARQKRVRWPGHLVQLSPADLICDLQQRLPAWLSESARTGSGLVLIGRRHLRSNNSWMHGVPSLVKGPDRATLLMHPSDAQRLGLAGGARVQIKSRIGAVEAPLEVTGSVAPGVVSLPHGYGHAQLAPHHRIASAVPGPNVNAITDASMVEPLLGTAVLNGVPVEVSAVAAASQV